MSWRKRPEKTVAAKQAVEQAVVKRVAEATAGVAAEDEAREEVDLMVGLVARACSG